MGIPNQTRQAASNAAAALGTWASIHGTPQGGGGDGLGALNGANEATGGGYSRKQFAWTPNGTGTNTSSEQTIPVPKGEWKEAGYWSASSGGTFCGSGPFGGSSIIITGDGGSIVTTLTVTC